MIICVHSENKTNQRAILIQVCACKRMNQLFVTRITVVVVVAETDVQK